MISVIIPAYNEEKEIARTISHLKNDPSGHLIKDIIVSDGGSTDSTVCEALKAGAVTEESFRKGRAPQMNFGAAVASADILYFLHADSVPPPNFATEIMKAVDEGITSGCFRLRFDHRHWFLQANCWFTRFNIDAIRFGDQSLFVTREAFVKAGGFDENLIVMEDQEIIHRIRRHGRFRVMRGAVTTSARKYLDNGIYRMQGIFFLVYFMYQLGYPQQKLVSTYKSMIKQYKL